MEPVSLFYRFLAGFAGMGIGLYVLVVTGPALKEHLAEPLFVIITLILILSCTYIGQTLGVIADSALHIAQRTKK